MAAREIPETTGGRKYKKLLRFGRIVAIIGLTLAVRELWVLLMDAGFHISQLEWQDLTFYGVLILGWSLIGWIAHRGTRRNLLPADWLIAALVLLIWAGIIVRKIS